LVVITAVSFAVSFSRRAVDLSSKREFGGARCGWKMMGGKLADLLARIP
jgi:hypothetical protein